jgi:hypothetical protein
VAECAVSVRPQAQAWAAPMTMGDIGEEITEIELEPLPEEPPAEAPAKPVTEPVPG